MTTALLDAVALAQSGQLDAALVELRQRPSKPAVDGHAHTLHAQIALAAGRPVEAETQARLAVRLGAGVPARLLLVTALRRQRRYADAAAELSAALAHDPNNANLHLQRAVLLHTLRDTRQSRRSAQRALELNPGLIDAERLMALLDQQQGARTASARRLRALLDRDLPPERAGPIGLDLARVLDQLGQSADAWHTMRTAQQHRRASPALQNIDPNRWPDLSKRIARWCQACKPDTAPPPLYPDPPIFVVGVPRSGTTLLEQMLDAHPDLTALDERPVLQTLLAHLPRIIGRPFRYPEDLPSLSMAERATAIEAWATIVRPLRRGPGTIVDKMPLNLPWLPLAWTLFPDAAMVLAVRDPRDSLISGLFQDLEPNEAMWHLASPDTSAALAHHTFALWEALGALPGFRAFEQRYEDLVRNPEATTRRLFDHLDRPWNASVLNYVAGARDKPISTPSRDAVSRPLTTRAIGRWRRYEAHVGGCLATLNPWLTRFGYPA